MGTEGVINPPTKKPWGTTQLICEQSNFEVHRIVVHKGGYCSTHYHKRKVNQFFVESGTLQITTFDYEAAFKTILHAKHSCIIPAGSVHSFTAIEDTVAYEIYWATRIGEDIVRLDKGML
jgi:mannose-6-phosphate isomerase-like protein (cupin superfamily)